MEVRKLSDHTLYLKNGPVLIELDRKNASKLAKDLIKACDMKLEDVLDPRIKKARKAYEESRVFGHR